MRKNHLIFEEKIILTIALLRILLISLIFSIDKRILFVILFYHIH